MFVCTRKAQMSQGESTDMHSKTGKQTINDHKQFVDIDRKIPGIKEFMEEKKHNTIIEYLSYVPDKLQEQVEQTNIHFNVEQVVNSKLEGIK